MIGIHTGWTANLQLLEADTWIIWIGFGCDDKSNLPKMASQWHHLFINWETLNVLAKKIVELGPVLLKFRCSKQKTVLWVAAVISGASSYCLTISVCHWVPPHVPLRLWTVFHEWVLRWVVCYQNNSSCQQLLVAIFDVFGEALQRRLDFLLSENAAAWSKLDDLGISGVLH